MESTCKACGANIDVATVLGTGERVALEKFTEPAGSGASRYRIVQGAPLTVERVVDDAPGSFFPDHQYDCVAGNAGHR